MLTSDETGGKTDVAAIDQFIPLIVGIGSCIAVIPELGHKIRNSKGSIATIFGPPLRPALLPLLSPTPPPSLSSAGSQESWSDRSDEHRVPDTGSDIWSTLITVLEELATQSNAEMTSGEKEYLQYQLQVARIARTRFVTGRLESRKTRRLDDAIEGIRVVLRAGSLSEYELPTVGMLSAARVKWDGQ